MFMGTSDVDDHQFVYRIADGEAVRVNEPVSKEDYVATRVTRDTSSYP